MQLMRDQWIAHPHAETWLFGFVPPSPPRVPLASPSVSPPPVASTSKRAVSKPARAGTAIPSKKGVATRHDPSQYCESSGLFVLLCR